MRRDNIFCTGVGLDKFDDGRLRFYAKFSLKKNSEPVFEWTGKWEEHKQMLFGLTEVERKNQPESVYLRKLNEVNAGILQRTRVAHTVVKLEGKCLGVLPGSDFQRIEIKGRTSTESWPETKIYNLKTFLDASQLKQLVHERKTAYFDVWGDDVIGIAGVESEEITETYQTTEQLIGTTLLTDRKISKYDNVSPN